MYKLYYSLTVPCFPSNLGNSFYSYIIIAIVSVLLQEEEEEQRKKMTTTEGNKVNLV